MKTSIQNLAKSQIEIKFEIPVEEFQSFIDKATSRLGESVTVEGFRPGKAPKEIIEKTLGQEKILQAASQDCIRESYIEFIKEQKLEPLGQPEIAILKLTPGNPLEFKAKIAVLPEMELPDYKTIASSVKKREVKVTEEEIQQLKQEKERAEKERLRQEILDKIAKDAKGEIPEVLITSEKNRMLAGVKDQVHHMLGISFEEYLQRIKKTEKEIMDSFANDAEKRVKSSLVLREVQRKENVAVDEKEVQKEMAEFEKHNPGIEKSQLKEYTESALKNEKTLQLLEDLTK
jgi:FKBP-type peptidyl-prolyl cis-trans isomerase (trigger factor)